MPVRNVESPGANPPIPPNFIPADYPILSQHWFGIEPFERKADTSADALAPAPQDLGDARFERAVCRVHRLGSRAMFELLCEIGQARQCRTFIEQRVEDYGRLDRHVLQAVNGDRMLPVPLHEVRP